MRNGVDRALTMPPAWQIEHTKSTAGALGTNVGGVQPAFFQLDPSLQFDSWLTLGNGEHDKVRSMPTSRLPDSHACTRLASDAHLPTHAVRMRR